MKTLDNIQSNESKNGMSQVIIDLRPQVKQQDGHGREVLADVHFRIDVRAYSNNLHTYTQEAREESNRTVTAFDREVVELLTAEGWTLKTENYGPGECPELVKGTQYLYCHPQDISGQVNPADIEALEAKIKAMTTCKYFTTDNYGDIIVTTSEADEKQLYRDTYADGLAAIWQEVTTTKRSNLYKDKGEAEHCVRRRICIANRRADLNDIGTGSYNMRTPLLQFLTEEYDRLLKDGYIKEAEGQNGRTLCRWINKKEEKELNKARREAFTPCTPDGRDLLPEPPAEITEQREQNDACFSSAESRRDKAEGQVTISIDGEGHEPTLYDRHNITAEEREAKAKGSALYIRHQARMASYAFYSHKGARIEASIAYRNGTDDPDGMSYKVCWYDETRTGELHLVECENGISLEQAARHMADFSLLSECGLTLREILYPAA